jgi:hypothetical protein
MTQEKMKLFIRINKILNFPIVIYFLFFCLLTYPLIFSFHTHLFADKWDGLQSLWHIWWVNKAVTGLHQSPWYTNYLYYPKGTSLLAQTMNPFNGFLGILLLKFLSLTETHNVIVIFSFIMGGVTAFWLSFYITRSYWGSLIAGYIFTFSQYHFAHAEGHLQVVALEWIPLFILCWYRLMAKPSVIMAIASGIVLFFVLLCDYYYFFYCVLTGIIITIWYAVSSSDLLFFLKKKYLIGLSVFLGFSFITSGVIVGSLLWLNIKDPLIGAHNPLEFSLDLLAPFIPGGHWRFATLTKFYWSKLPGNINESSVYIGLSVALLLCYAWYKRKELQLQYPSFFLWYGLLVFFGIMALGPVLQLAGKTVFTGPMPYAFLQLLFPPLKLSGCPVRMMVMVMLSAAVISAIALSSLLKTKGIGKIFIIASFIFLMSFDFMPKPLPSSKLDIPAYVEILKGLPKEGGMIDTVNQIPTALYYQTIHEIPMADGYISRSSISVCRELERKKSAIENKNYFSLLNDFNTHYILISSVKYTDSGRLKKIYEKDGIILCEITDGRKK